MKTIIKALLLTTVLVGCNKNEKATTANCDCKERHEIIETYQTPQGTLSTHWVLNYETPNVVQDCSTATDWAYYGNGDSKRVRVICQ